jgi:DNA-binding PadR family transcriptional regulator
MRPRVPRISHLQFLALGTLVAGERSGRAIRDQAGGFGIRRTAAAFYQLMARLERDGLVEGWYQPVRVGDQAVTERWYRITPAGTRAWSATREFYQHVIRAAGEGWSSA